MSASKTIPKFVGTVPMRLLCIMFGACFATNIAIGRSPDLFDYKKVMHLLAFVFGFSTFVCLIFSFRKIFLLWTKFGELLNSIVTILIFSFFYMFIFPIFTLLHFMLTKLNLKENRGSNTFWRRKSTTLADLTFFKRMG